MPIHRYLRPFYFLHPPHPESPYRSPVADVYFRQGTHANDNKTVRSWPLIGDRRTWRMIYEGLVESDMAVALMKAGRKLEFVPSHPQASTLVGEKLVGSAFRDEKLAHAPTVSPFSPTTSPSNRLLRFNVCPFSLFSLSLFLFLELWYNFSVCRAWTIAMDINNTMRHESYFVLEKENPVCND